MEERDSRKKVALKGELTIQRVAAIQRRLHSLLNSSDITQIELNLSAIEQLDSSGLQLLLALDKELNGRGGGLTLTKPSAAVEKCLYDYNLSDHFGSTTPPSSEVA